MARRTLKKRKDGYYRAWACGRQLYGRTQKEAIGKAEDYKARMMLTGAKGAGQVLFLPYADSRIDAYYARANEASRKMYHRMVRFADSHLIHHCVAEIGADELQILCDSLSVYSASYVRKFMNLMRNIFRSAQANGLRLTNPMEAVRSPEGLPTVGHRVLKEEERELIRSTWREHDFDPAAMVMLYAGLRRGEVLYLDIDRDVNFFQRTITVRGSVSFSEGNGNQPTISSGKTKAAQRTIPLAAPLAEVLLGRHGLLLCKRDGSMMSQSAFERKFASYICFLETRLNGYEKRQYGKTNEHLARLEAGMPLPEWRQVTFRCHDLRKDFCTRGKENGISQKAMQTWMGHAGPEMINRVYWSLTEEQSGKDAERLMQMDGNKNNAREACM